jgi:hypothetical protein
MLAQLHSISFSDTTLNLLSSSKEMNSKVTLIVRTL